MTEGNILYNRYPYSNTTLVKVKSPDGEKYTREQRLFKYNTC